MRVGGTLTVSEPECLPPSVPEALPPSPVQLTGKCVKLGLQATPSNPTDSMGKFPSRDFLGPSGPTSRARHNLLIPHKVGMDHFEGGGSVDSASYPLLQHIWLS